MCAQNIKLVQTHIKDNDMEYNILVDTEFFNLLSAGKENKDGNALEKSYREFIKVVVELCSSNVKQAVFALSYAETELDFHLSMPHVKDCLETIGLYVRKAVTFVRRMQEYVAATYRLHANALTSETSPPVTTEPKPLVKWTGNAIDLVEMVYGICVMGSVNDGDVKFKDLAQAMYQFFGIKAKDCYRFYTDIRRRKNHSRTYFLDRMQEKLNDKMRKDDELERMRR